MTSKSKAKTTRNEPPISSTYAKKTKQKNLFIESNKFKIVNKFYNS